MASSGWQVVTYARTQGEAIRALRWQQKGNRNAPPMFQSEFRIVHRNGVYAIESRSKAG